MPEAPEIRVVSLTRTLKRGPGIPEPLFVPDRPRPVTDRSRPRVRRVAGGYAFRSMQPANSGLFCSSNGIGKFTSEPYVPPLKKLPVGKTDSVLRPY
jgi:hypothetical protein